MLTILIEVLLLLSVGLAETRLTHCSIPRLIVFNPVLVPRSSPEAFHVEQLQRPLSAKGGIMGEK
jgi:hypothetical protein